MMMIGMIGVTGNNNKASEPGTSTFNCSRFGVVLSRLAVLKKKFGVISLTVGRGLATDPAQSHQKVWEER